MSLWGPSGPDGPTSNQCHLVLSATTTGTEATMLWSMGPSAGLKSRLLWRSMSFQPDEQSASSKDLYPNQYIFQQGTCAPPVHSSHPCVFICALSRGLAGVCTPCMSDSSLAFKLYSNKAGCCFVFYTWCLCICMSQVPLLVQVCKSLTAEVFFASNGSKVHHCLCMFVIDGSENETYKRHTAEVCQLWFEKAPSHFSFQLCTPYCFHFLYFCISV